MMGPLSPWTWTRLLVRCLEFGGFAGWLWKISLNLFICLIVIGYGWDEPAWIGEWMQELMIDGTFSFCICDNVME